MPNAPTKRLRILVVDDEKVMRELLMLHLKEAGYEVLAAEDPVAAGPLVLKEKPDLLIVDVHMPYMTGYEFVAALKSDPETRDIPVIFLSTDDDVADQARTLGAAAFLSKPVTVDKLLKAVGLFAK
jgi:two-component system chemotaxis response regulator CheY